MSLLVAGRDTVRKAEQTFFEPFALTLFLFYRRPVRLLLWFTCLLNIRMFFDDYARR